MSDRKPPRLLVALHGLAAVLTAVMGIVYLSRSQIMPYHLEALQTTWEAIEPAYRVLFLAFMKGVGAGYLAAGVALCIAVFGPLRRGQRWPLWAAPLVEIISMVPLAGIILYVGANTPAEPPLVFPVVVLGLSAAGVIVSLVLRGGRGEAEAP